MEGYEEDMLLEGDFVGKEDTDGEADDPLGQVLPAAVMADGGVFRCGHCGLANRLTVAPIKPKLNVVAKSDDDAAETTATVTEVIETTPTVAKAAKRINVGRFKCNLCSKEYKNRRE